MNRTKTLVASLFKQTHLSPTFRSNRLPTVAITRESLKPSSAHSPTISVKGPLLFPGRGFCSESRYKCWNCEKAAFLFCDSCRCIQPVDDSVDYFQIFGLEKKYEIDPGSLEGKYKDWQKKLHPDLVHNKSQRERDYAAEQSAKVTEALRTLTKQLSRAMYIMKLSGVNVNEEETITDPTLLMEIMELREAISEASDSKELNQIRSQAQEKLNKCSDAFVEAFESQKYDEAVKCIQRMTYYERACEEIVKKL